MLNLHWQALVGINTHVLKLTQSLRWKGKKIAVFQVSLNVFTRDGLN